ncbi:MAG: hypothetical protein H6Q44_583 [Deltaproteobacteria bacterium]|jgi:hypothetical protein|nr:hypothetical protein [Deltaproteobacteria bacterium]
MKEAIAPIPRSAVRPTLDAVRKRFETWRKRGRARRRISNALWGTAVGLCRDHSVSKVSRALRLDYYGLRKRAHKIQEANSGTDLGFVKLDLGTPLVSVAEWRVEMEAPNGAKMTLSLKGAPRDLNPLELSRAFWSQGR